MSWLFVMVTEYLVVCHGHGITDRNNFRGKEVGLDLELREHSQP